jgi:HEAT repeat protein
MTTKEMITYYCPNCWRELSEQDDVCPTCGYLMADFSRLALEEKLLLSLSHPVLDSQMMAAQILGNLGSTKALPQFEVILSDPKTKIYLLREVIQALSKIRHPKSAELLRKAMGHFSPLIRRLVEEQLYKMKTGGSGAIDQTIGQS